MSQKSKRLSRSNLLRETAVGHRRNGMRYPRMEALESRILLSYTFLISGATATVTPTAATGGSILIDEVVSFGSPVLEHSEDGGANFSQDWDDSTAGVQFLAAATSSTVNLTPTTGAGSSITLGDATSPASNIFANINLGPVGTPANNSLIIDDSASVHAAGNYDFYSTLGSISGPGGTTGGINITTFGPVNSYTIFGGSGNNTFNMHSTFNATTTSNTIVGGAGDDVVNVLGDTFPGIGTPLTIDMQGGTNTVNLGNGGSLSSIASTVVVTDTGGTTALTLNGQNDTTHASATLDNLSGNIGAPFEITGLSSGTIEYGSGITAVNVNGGTNGGSGITYTINNTQSGTTTTITGGANENVFNLSNSGLAGGLDNLPGGVVVHGGSSGTDTVTLEDSSASFNDNYTVTDTTVSRAVFGGLTYDGIGTLTLNAENTLGTNGNNTITINSTASGVTTNINGQGGVDTITVNGTGSSGTLNISTGGTDGSTVNVVANATATHITMNAAGTVNIGSTGGNGTMTGILGSISVTDPPNFIALNFHDENDTTGQTWTLDNNDLGPTGSVAVTGLGTTSYNPDDLTSLTVNGGSGGNTFNVNNTSGFFATTLNTGNGDDTASVSATGNNTLNIVGSGGLDAVTLGGLAGIGAQDLTGTINVNTSLGITGITLDDSQNTSASTATLSDDGTTSTFTGLAPATINVTDGAISTLSVLGGSGGDTFNLGGNTVNLTLTGGAGTNVLNYDAQGLTPTVVAGGSAGEVIINLTGFGQVDSSGYGTANFTDMAAPTITPGTALSLNDVVGVPLNATFGTFTLPLPPIGTPPGGFPVGDFTATLSWGDGSPTQAATLTANGSNPKVYSLSGTHTFAAKGNFTVSNSISFAGDSYGSALNGVTLNVTLPASGPTSGNSATVTSAPTTTALTIATQPRNGVAGVALGRLVIDVRTLRGAINTADHSNVTLSVASGPGVLTGTLTVAAINGIATFTNVFIDVAGNYTLKISDNGASIISKSIVVTPAAVASLVFGALPTTAEAGSVIAPGFTVKAFDAFGNAVNRGRVNISIATGPAVRLDGSRSASIVNGVATFNNLRIRTAGSYTLQATSSAITMTSGSFLITPGAVTTIVFQNFPPTVGSGTPIAGTITIVLEDQWGNVAINSSGTVELALSPNKQGVVLGGTTDVAVVNGVATFDDLDITTAGRYNLVAFFDGLNRSHKLVVNAGV